MGRLRQDQSHILTEEQVARFEMLSPMLDSALGEMREFSKKKQDGVLNPLKVRMINRLLGELKELLEGDPSSAYLDLLDEETLPQNSDAVLVLSQYRAAMDQFEAKHQYLEYGRDQWRTRGGGIEASRRRRS